MINFSGQDRLKRLFRATRKLNIPDLVSHITQRAAGKEPLFLENKDYLSMLWLLKETTREYSLNMYAFCLMPNHVHLLLSPTTKNLYDSMRYLFSRYASIFNRKYERKGHLFGGPYRQAVCLDDVYLVAASLYIHLNPLKAGLVSDPMAYRWSSCRLYCEDVAPRSFVDPHFVLDLLSEKTLEKKERYRHLLEHGGQLHADEVLEAKVAVERFSGDLASEVPSLIKWLAKKKSIIKPSALALMGVDELERQIDALKKKQGLKKPETKKARRYLIEQLIARGYKRHEIAKRLGISRKTVYNLLKS